MQGLKSNFGVTYSFSCLSFVSVTYPWEMILGWLMTFPSTDVEYSWIPLQIMDFNNVLISFILFSYIMVEIIVVSLNFCKLMFPNLNRSFQHLRSFKQKWQIWLETWPLEEFHSWTIALTPWRSCSRAQRIMLCCSGSALSCCAMTRVCGSLGNSSSTKHSFCFSFEPWRATAISPWGIG